MSRSHTLASVGDLSVAAPPEQLPDGKYCPHSFSTPVGRFVFGIEGDRVVALFTSKDPAITFDFTMFGVTRPLHGSGRIILGTVEQLQRDDNIALWVQIKSSAGDYNSTLVDGPVRLKVK